MTMRVEEILSEIRLGVMARNPTLAEELLELPASVWRVPARRRDSASPETNGQCARLPRPT
jgi:hypothetical protein